jgi:hypothetical protein
VGCYLLGDLTKILQEVSLDSTSAENSPTAEKFSVFRFCSAPAACWHHYSGFSRQIVLDAGAICRPFICLLLFRLFKKNAEKYG